MTWFIGLLKILLNELSRISWFQIRRNIGETFVYVGNKISGRHRYMEPIIDLVINDENKEEFLYKVSLVTRRYDIEIGIYETYEEAGQVCDNIEATIKELHNAD